MFFKKPRAKKTVAVEVVETPVNETPPAPDPEAKAFMIKTLKDKFFDLAAQERIGKTPELTKEIDELVANIRNLDSK